MSASLTVFVCGTYTDLSDERSGVLEAILRLRHQHDSMEFFGARHNQPIETCLDEVRRSDVLVVIVGHLYGSIVPEMGISYTEAEYREGNRLGKPCLVYLRSEDIPVLPKFMERDPDKIVLLRQFKETLGKRHTVAKFKDVKDLSVGVAADLSRTAQELAEAANANVVQQIAILKQGVEVWNAWRVKNPATSPDLSSADLTGLNLSYIDFRQTKLVQASLQETTLVWANLAGADLRDADLSGALLGETIFSKTNLSKTKGLATCGHAGTSAIDDRTLRQSWPLPLAFLQGCGMDEVYIEYLPSLLNQAIEFYSCFISYSQQDAGIAQHLHADLQDHGVRCWFAPQDLKIGMKIRSSIDDAIRIHDKLLVILSESSVESGWVEMEVESALKQERSRGQTVLFPIRIDDAVMDSEQGWTRVLRRTRHIGDFKDWEDHDKYKRAFERLLRGLRTEDEIDENVLINWFLERYEDPAESVPYESREGGYQYLGSEPYDALEILEENFPDLDADIIEKAISELERQTPVWVEKNRLSEP